ncbi:conserved exported hypothetical protein [Candidatus Accumulibacter aalborgensis]|uniref:Uncharacterized protein n=1 Tax=Candidatus Accumulibacter aalborgensis TaxID=1860102 RepID=A0A1A8XHJ5_9PROT|nr:hypothetical protein [Candidatus Accumulibacter aalborgensis]SBT04166.1 conserved exported hypothetical protein [Candidatus Accumulibacter aalborgensis]
MKRLLFAAVLAAVTGSALASDVAVSVSIGQPGFYGHLDVGGYPPPQLIYRQPVIIERVPVVSPPIYLNVPPAQARNWRQHCGAYNACNERVYFVQNSWYNREYVPRYQEYQRERGEDYRDERKHDNRGKHGNKHHGGDHDQGRGR